MATPAPRNIDEYIAAAPAGVRPILEKLRTVIKENAPEARERISYRMPAFAQHGILIYFAAFKGHIGIFPPVRGDARLERAVSRFAGEKGNLRFPLDEPIPYSLVARIVKFRVKQQALRAASRKKRVIKRQ